MPGERNELEQLWRAVILQTMSMPLAEIEAGERAHLLPNEENPRPANLPLRQPLSRRDQLKENARLAIYLAVGAGSGLLFGSSAEAGANDIKRLVEDDMDEGLQSSSHFTHTTAAVASAIIAALPWFFRVSSSVANSLANACIMYLSYAQGYANRTLTTEEKRLFKEFNSRVVPSYLISACMNAGFLWLSLDTDPPPSFETIMFNFASATLSLPVFAYCAQTVLPMLRLPIYTDSSEANLSKIEIAAANAAKAALIGHLKGYVCDGALQLLNDDRVARKKFYTAGNNAIRNLENANAQAYQQALRDFFAVIAQRDPHPDFLKPETPITTLLQKPITILAAWVSIFAFTISGVNGGFALGRLTFPKSPLEAYYLFAIGLGLFTFFPNAGFSKKAIENAKAAKKDYGDFDEAAVKLSSAHSQSIWVADKFFKAVKIGIGAGSGGSGFHAGFKETLGFWQNIFGDPNATVESVLKVIGEVAGGLSGLGSIVSNTALIGQILTKVLAEYVQYAATSEEKKILRQFKCVDKLADNIQLAKTDDFLDLFRLGILNANDVTFENLSQEDRGLLINLAPVPAAQAADDQSTSSGVASLHSSGHSMWSENYSGDGGDEHDADEDDYRPQSPLLAGLRSSND